MGRGPDDVLEIERLLYRYGRAIDTRDLESLREVFAPDAEIHYAVTGGTRLPLSEMIGWLRGALTQFRVTQHAITTPIIELDGDRARSECYLSAAHVQERTDGREVYVMLHGIYRDEWVRRPEGWRISRRRLDHLYATGAFAAPDQVKHFEKPVPQGF
jgi:hypothetical protein